MSKSNKKTKRAAPDRAAKKMEGFPLLHQNSAGIDVGSMLMVVSYTDREGKINLREFDSFTSSLNELAGLLQREGVEKVVMEATGPYWTIFWRSMVWKCIWSIQATTKTYPHKKRI
jgi:transposase